MQKTSIPDDVAGCHGKNCDKRDRCWRYVAAKNRNPDNLNACWVHIPFPVVCDEFISI